MQIHTSSAHTISKCESFQHLSPQAQEALLSLKKIRNFGCEKTSDLIDVKKITTNNLDNLSNMPEVIIDQVVKHPPQNEFMGSQNFSFIQNSKQLLAFKNSIVPDDPTPDFSDALSSDRIQICETAQNQQYFQKQLRLMQTLQSKDLNQVNKYIRKPTQEKENKINHNQKNNYHQNRLSDLISKEITKNTQPQSSNNIRKNSHTSINTHNTSQTKCNLSTQQDYLYQKAIFQQEKLKTFIEKGQIMNNVKEMKECTFNPKINQKSKIINSSTFFDRQNTWMRKKNDKISLQVEIQKEKATRECTFSPNYKDNSNVRINSCDVYYRNLQWQNKMNRKKQQMRNSMIDFNNHDIKNNSSKMQIQRSNSTQTINQQTDLKQLLEIQFKQDVPKYMKSNTPTHQATETTITPNSQCGYMELGKRKNSLEQIEQKYKLLYDLVQSVTKNSSKKKK
ncbi:unnamed protein product [Paramecium primaurelia]|uniref:Uncharacterized protein n=1 Tax=Paramecium primaurelia TaxID=5886 RepID=A0A8S1KG76_PARPR|nr:unnamed protein product [Paramecium primaurelia]